MTRHEKKVSNETNFAINPPKGYFSAKRPAGVHPAAKPLKYYLDRLSAASGGKAEFSTDADHAHNLTVTHPFDTDMRDHPISLLHWSGWEDPKIDIQGLRHRPGEILNIISAKPGVGMMLHDTARAIARAHPDIAPPRHSFTRTERGAHWVPEEQMRYEEPVWGQPPEWHRQHALWVAHQNHAARINDRRYREAMRDLDFGSEFF